MRDLHDIYVIARRELLERIKSKWFVGIHACSGRSA